ACWVDAIWSGRRGSRQGRARWLYCLLPPLRLGACDHATGKNIWLPGLGWQPVGRELEQRLERVSSVPMILMALMVLPLIGVEYFWAERLEADPLLSGLLNGAGGLIWFAFAGEFILRLSIAHSKWGYVKSHFIDLAIVLLPLVTFLQALRLGRLLRLQQLTRTARLYRLRGVALRAWRALLLIDAVSRLINGPAEKRLVKLRATLVQKEHELTDLRAEIAKLEAMAAATNGSSAEASPVDVAVAQGSTPEQAA
ncbi:MAG: potassium channel protein, partial [Candidatus Saccharimonas sp.]|nr:potassium channel protein [Planctomycetaceae bacterium]